MRNPIDIVASLIGDINREITASETYINQDGLFVLKTCNAKYAAVGMDVNDASIVSVSETEIILSKNTISPFYLPAPKYYYGTLVELNKAINSISQIPTATEMAYPMVYFPEIKNRVKMFGKSEKEMQISADLIIALPYSNLWGSSEFKENGTDPCLKLVEELTSVIQNNKNIEILRDSWDITVYSKLGEKRDIKGAIATIINDRCTGVILEIDLIVYKNFKCKC